MRTELKYTYVVKRRYWRFRRGDLNTALPGKPGDPEFHAKYAELLALTEQKPGAAKDSWSWIIDRYRKSAEFRSLADTTQLDYEQTLRLLKDELGDQPFRLTTRGMIKAVRDDYADKPRKAHKIKQMASRLYSWADESDFVPAGLNPAADVKRLKRKGGEREIVVWSDHEIELFLKHAPERLATPVMIALYTGQRKEDVLSMTWQQYQRDMIRVRQSKTRAMLDIACHDKLRAYLDKLTRRGLLICLRDEDKPWSSTSNVFGAALYRQIQAIEDMPNNRSLHGLRYAAGSKMEEAGCTVAEIESVLGHSTFKMALKYSSQRLRAKAAMEKMERTA